MTDYTNKSFLTSQISSKRDLGDRQGAFEDLQKAAQLFQQQQDPQNYKKAVEVLERLQASGATNPVPSSSAPAESNEPTNPLPSSSTPVESNEPTNTLPSSAPVESNESAF